MRFLGFLLRLKTGDFEIFNLFISKEFNYFFFWFEFRIMGYQFMQNSQIQIVEDWTEFDPLYFLYYMHIRYMQIQ